MALLIDPLPVKAQALFPRCSVVCGCIVLFSLGFLVVCAALPASRSCGRCFSSVFLSDPLGTSSSRRKQRYRHNMDQWYNGRQRCEEWPSPGFGRSAVARSHHGRKDVMFGPVITEDVCVAFAGARVHSNNTAEMSAIVEALSFLGLHGPVARDSQSCVFLMIPSMLLVLGHSSCSHARTAWTSLPKVIVESPAQSTIYHAARPALSIVQARGRQSMRGARRSGISCLLCKSFRSNAACAASPGCCCVGGCHTHVQQRRAASGDSSGSEWIILSGLFFCEFCDDCWVRESQLPSGFSGAAGSTMLELSPGMSHMEAMTKVRVGVVAEFFFARW